MTPCLPHHPGLTILQDVCKQTSSPVSNRGWRRRWPALMGGPVPKAAGGPAGNPQGGAHTAASRVPQAQAPCCPPPSVHLPPGRPHEPWQAAGRQGKQRWAARGQRQPAAAASTVVPECGSGWEMLHPHRFAGAFAPGRWARSRGGSCVGALHKGSPSGQSLPPPRLHPPPAIFLSALSSTRASGNSQALLRLRVTHARLPRAGVQS